VRVVALHVGARLVAGRRPNGRRREAPRAGRAQIGDIVYDMSEPGIMVAYSMVEGEAVLLSFRDLFGS